MNVLSLVSGSVILLIALFVVEPTDGRRRTWWKVFIAANAVFLFMLVATVAIERFSDIKGLRPVLAIGGLLLYPATGLFIPLVSEAVRESPWVAFVFGPLGAFIGFSGSVTLLFILGYH